MQHPRSFHNKSFTLLQQNQSAFTANLLHFCNKTKALSQQIFYPFTTKQKRFHSKSFTLSKQKRFHSKSITLLQQNKSAFTANLLPSCKNKRSEATKQKLLNAKTKSSSALKR